MYTFGKVLRNQQPVNKPVIPIHVVMDFLLPSLHNSLSPISPANHMNPVLKYHVLQINFIIILTEQATTHLTDYQITYTLS